MFHLHFFISYAKLIKILVALHNNNESNISRADTVQTEQAGAAAREPGRMATVDYNICGTVVTIATYVGVFLFYNGKFFSVILPRQRYKYFG